MKGRVFFAGVGASAAGIALSWGWMPVARAVDGTAAVHEAVPAWLRVMVDAAWWWLPLAVGALLLCLALARKRHVTFAAGAAYVAGVLVTCVVVVIYLVFGPRPLQPVQPAQPIHPPDLHGSMPESGTSLSGSPEDGASPSRGPAFRS